MPLQQRRAGCDESRVPRSVVSPSVAPLSTHPGGLGVAQADLGSLPGPPAGSTSSGAPVVPQVSARLGPFHVRWEPGLLDLSWVISDRERPGRSRSLSRGAGAVRRGYAGTSCRDLTIGQGDVHGLLRDVRE
jgi:hypothetical protein